MNTILIRIRKSKLAKFIREKLLSIPCIGHRVQAYKIEREKQRIIKHLKRHHLRWELIMSGQTMRGNESDHRTLVDVTDGAVIVSHMNGRVIEYAGPVFIDSTNWGL